MKKKALIIILLLALSFGVVSAAESPPDFTMIELSQNCVGGETPKPPMAETCYTHIKYTRADGAIMWQSFMPQNTRTKLCVTRDGRRWCH